MLSALFWTLLFIVVVVVIKQLHAHVRNNQGIRALYERLVKDRLDLIKKIGIFVTVILWAGIWLITRGDEKASIGSLMKDFSSSWTKQESQMPPAINKE